MTDRKPTRSIATHLAVFVLGVLAGAAWHPCTVITTPVGPEPGAADTTGGP